MRNTVRILGKSVVLAGFLVLLVILGRVQGVAAPTDTPTSEIPTISDTPWPPPPPPPPPQS